MKYVIIAAYKNTFSEVVWEYDDLNEASLELADIIDNNTSNNWNYFLIGVSK